MGSIFTSTFSKSAQNIQELEKIEKIEKMLYILDVLGTFAKSALLKVLKIFSHVYSRRGRHAAYSVRVKYPCGQFFLQL